MTIIGQSLSARHPHYVFNVVGVGEHVDRLHFLHAVEAVHEGEVARLCRRVAADVDDAFGTSV